MSIMNPNRVALGVVLMIGAVGGCASPASPTGPRWYKGNLHTHSLWSDGDDFPERIATWYRDRGYDFLGISDHNTAQQGDKWVKFADLYKKGAGPATDAYLKDFAGRAKVRGDRAAGTQEVRLTPFADYSKSISQTGKFLLIPSEEISDKFEKKPIHMNATNVGQAIKPQGGNSVVEVIRNNFRAADEQAKRLNRPILTHLNHPNFGWGVTAEELAEVVEEHFFEIYNGHPSVNQPGDKDHPSVERIWDVANTLRITAFNAPPLFGLGTDDSHHYHVEGMSRSTPGRGWVCVWANALTARDLIVAMQAGNFYASNGVVLREVKFDAPTGTLEVEIEPDGDAKYTTTFVGSAVGADRDPAKVGMTFATVEGTRATYKLAGNELYVRAVVTSDKPPANPSFKGQVRQAWTQPVGWTPRLKSARDSSPAQP
jgi:hypothetical protein